MSLVAQTTVLLLVDIMMTNVLIDHQDIVVAAVAEVGIEVGNGTEIETENAVIVFKIAALVRIGTKALRVTKATEEVVVEVDIINRIGHCIKLNYC